MVNVDEVKNAYYLLENKKTKQSQFVEHCEGDWYFSIGVKKSKYVSKHWAIKEMLFRRPDPIKDSDFHTVVKAKSDTKTKKKEETIRAERKGRQRIDATTLQSNSKYLTEYKTIN